MTRRNAITTARLSALTAMGRACAAVAAIPGVPRLTGLPAMRRTIRTLSLGVLIYSFCAASPAQDNYREQMKGLDEQVQEIKSDVLGIAAELNKLEEKLLYPSNTQIALFVELENAEAVRLDAVQIQIDGQPVARYIYSYQELEALKKGGVQRIYTGNVPTGAHELEVSVLGKLEGGSDYSETGRFTIQKSVEPKLVGITLAGPDSGKPAIEIGDW